MKSIKFICLLLSLHITHAHAKTITEELQTIKAFKIAQAYFKQSHSDAQITANVIERFVQEKLFSEAQIKEMPIHVQTKDGIVFLTGKTTSPEQANDAIALAKSIKGVKQVDSKIEILIGPSE